MSGILVSEYGDSTDVLKQGDVLFDVNGTIPEDCALVEMRFAGLNFIDVYYRTGLYKKPQVPFVTCDEGSGVILRLPAQHSSSLKVGDRVAFFRGSTGAAATHALVKLADLYPVPESMSDEEAASVLLQGATAHYLSRSCFPVKQGDWVLVQAAAGGTGLLLSQVCHHLGATVIGTCGGPTKSALAASFGKVDHVIDYNAFPIWEDEVKRLTAERGGVDVVFDGVGRSTFLGGLKSLKRRGHMITFGNASGPVDPISPLLLTQHGSITLQRPTLKDFSASGGEIEGRVHELFTWISEGHVKVSPSTVFSLAKAADAFKHLEGRLSTGKVLLRCLL